MAFRRSRSEKGAGPVSPLVAELFEWAAQFEAGSLSDPALIDGTLEPGERFAVRVGPVTAVEFVVDAPRPDVAAAGPTGSLVATDRRALLQTDGGVALQWGWGTDIEAVTALSGGVGLMWLVKDEDRASGMALRGVVIPAYARGELSHSDGAPPMQAVFKRVEVAWRASQPGGLAAWREQFAARYGRP